MRLSAVHVNHRLQPAADDWAAHCRGICASLAVPLTVAEVNVLPQGDGLEAAARRARYAVFEKLEASWLLLAHHADDQAETLLLRLLRGTGVHGAAGMPATRPLGAGMRLGRPLLTLCRAELLAYAHQHGLRWVEDGSNADSAYQRNWLRHQVLPVLADRQPAAAARLAAVAERFGEAATLLDEVAAADLKSLRQADGGLSLAGLKALSPARQANALRARLAAAGGRLPGAARLHEFLRQCALADAESLPLMLAGPHSLRGWRGAVHVAPSEPRWVAVQDFPGAGEWGWGDGSLRVVVAAGGWRLPAASALTLRPCPAGARLRLRGMRRSLKHLMADAGLPPWWRPVAPALFDGDTLVGVPGVAVDDAYRGRDGEPGWQLVWQPWQIMAEPCD